MKKHLKCLLCKKPGYSKLRGYYDEVLVLAFNPNVRSGPKPWICRKCITKHSKLTDESFIELILKVKQQKS